MGRKKAEQSAPLQDLRHSHGLTLEMYVNKRGDYKISPHKHPHFELLYILRGCRGFRINGKNFRARGGDLIIFRPDEIHDEYACSKTISLVCMRFNSGDLADNSLAFPQTENIGPILHLANKDYFSDLFSRMLQERESPQEDSETLLGAYMVEFIVTLRRAIADVMRKSGVENSGHGRVNRAIESIHQNITQDLNLADLARASFMSVSHFSHVFKAATGESPKSFLIKERIEEAKRLLKKTDLPAREIAEKLGYANPYFFYRQFKKRTGLTTSEYRKDCPTSDSE